eukprot:TRINITY_DN126_c0_g1_i3.p1 TRINITY_DN126_c0_g1~~TRINITY_DN126_c0_g1_i3.p1  ORF type:complete len:854 (-),score=272.54 TRINITY_DN126_c0_g1_i3:78-2312(-)
MKNKRKVNLLHLAFAQFCNHDIARYGFNFPNATAGSATRPNWDWNYSELTARDPVFAWNFTATSPSTWQGVEMTLRGINASALDFVFRLAANMPANGTGPGTGNPRNAQYNGPPTWDIDPIYGNSGALSGPDGTLVAATRFNNATGELLIETGAAVGFAPDMIVGASYLAPGAPAIITLFAKEHNWYARQLRTLRPDLNGTAIYRLARRWTIAVYQSITFYEYAPIIFNGPMPSYEEEGYVQKDDFAGPIEIAMICHYPYSEYNSYWPIVNSNWEEIASVPAKGYFGTKAKTGEVYAKFGHAALIRGLIHGVQDNVDLYFNEGIRVLAGAGQATSDAPARMIARSRDQGLPTYNDIRAAWNLTRLQSIDDFAKIGTPHPAHLAALKKSYNNDIDSVDFFVGGLAEWHEDTHMGELWTKIYKQYWIDVRKHDKWWFEGEAAGFTSAEIEQLKNTKISNLILKHYNDSIDRLPCAAFFALPADCPSAPQLKCKTDSNPNLILLADDQIQLSWKNKTAATGDAVTFTIKAPTTGFVAFGFPKTAGRMLGSRVFVGRVWDSDQSVNVTPSLITARSPCVNGKGVCPTTDNMYNVTDVSGTQINGTTTITLTVSPVPSGNISIVASFGSADDLQYHGPNKGVGEIIIDVSEEVPMPTCAPCATCAEPVTCPEPITCAPEVSCPPQVTCAACPTVTCPTTAAPTTFTTIKPATCAPCPTQTTAAPKVCSSGLQLLPSLFLVLISVLLLWN